MIWVIFLTRQRWNDERLAYNNKPQYSDVEYLTLSHEQFKNIWVPDTFFRNEIESHAFENMAPNFYVRIFPNGDVQYSRRLALKTTCSPNWQAGLPTFLLGELSPFDHCSFS